MASKKTKGQKTNEKCSGSVDEGVQGELSELNQLVNNIDMMHSESQGALIHLMEQTDKLNESIQHKFHQFRKKGVKVRQFSASDKAKARKALEEFELSGDED